MEPFRGYLQSDGYAAEGKEGVCLVSCLAHIKRHYEVAKEENKSQAEYVLAKIQELYRIEQVADMQGISPEMRMSKRQEQALPILDELKQWMETTYPKALPKSRMRQAIAYAYTLEPRMRNYLKDGRLKIDNNLAENAIRPIALSRKNFLFCGNHETAENTAVICSLLVPKKAYRYNCLVAVLYKRKDLKELLPNYWKQRNSKEI